MTSPVGVNAPADAPAGVNSAIVGAEVVDPPVPAELLVGFDDDEPPPPHAASAPAAKTAPKIVLFISFSMASSVKAEPSARILNEK
ncbi:MAG: hypothetical protein WCA85_11070 [Paraburkholderia sp.]|uniref:hypothetical protein n=1 Tax=Paraburkholderia sp. TaxID=1926495 RepID=UPI003C542D1F